MKSTLKLLSFFMLFSVVFSCGDPQQPELEMAELVEGSYVGTLRPIGYTDEPQRAYVIMEKRASDAVSCKVECEAFDFFPSAVMLKVEEGDHGVYYLESETNMSISGSFKSNTLSLTMKLGDTTWQFQGNKD